MSAGPRERRIALLVSEYGYFLSHRLALAQAAADQGYHVHVITRVPANTAPVHRPGLDIVPLDMHRSLGNPLVELRRVWSLAALFRRLQPAIVHNVSLKLAVVGSLAAYLSGVPGVVNAFTGLGYTFRSEGFLPTALACAISPVLALIARHPGCWSIFQNEDDLDYFRRRGLAVADRTLLIRGSGVDTQSYVPAPEAEGDPVVLFAGRLLLDKGIGEFVEAARLLRRQGIAARFAAAGETDPENPRSIGSKMLAAWKTEGVVEWWGGQADMPAVYRRAHVICLPSYHEGLPKVLLEAAACGRPIVATSIAGCREIVEHGINGLLVPPRDPAALADAVAKLLVDREARARMGANGRRIVEQNFTVQMINAQVLDLYARLQGLFPVPRGQPG